MATAAFTKGRCCLIKERSYLPPRKVFYVTGRVTQMLPPGRFFVTIRIGESIDERSGLMKLRKGDLLVITLVLLAAALLFVSRHFPQDAESRLLRVELDGQLMDEIFFDTSTRKSFAVRMPAGEATVEIADGRVRVLEMPREVCPLGLCSSVGWVEQSGDAIVCLPNRLVLTVLGGSANELWDSLDGVTE